MDGVLFDSMPRHAIAWEEVMKQHGLSFTAYDCYINEGRTAESVIREAFQKALGRDATQEEVKTIYAEKSAYYHQLLQTTTPTIPGIEDVLQFVKHQGHQIWVVTGSGMRTLLDSLNTVAYTDDRYVYKVSAIKKYDAEDYIEINIKEME